MPNQFAKAFGDAYVGGGLWAMRRRCVIQWIPIGDDVAAGGSSK